MRHGPLEQRATNAEAAVRREDVAHIPVGAPKRHAQNGGRCQIP